MNTRFLEGFSAMVFVSIVALALILLVLSPSDDVSAAFTEGGINYETTVGGVTVVGYEGYPVNVEIPSTVENEGTSYNVVSVQNNAFSNCKTLETITVSSATSIGDGSFFGCALLTSASLPKATTIGGYVFSGCTSLASVSLPEATMIGVEIFSDCTSLTSASLSKATTIRQEAFKGCTSLTSISLPVAEEISNRAFYGCTSLASVSLPEATTIKNKAFSGCTSLASVSLPEATTIEVGAFNDCTRLESVSISAGATFGSNPFSGCRNLKAIVLMGATQANVDATVSWKIGGHDFDVIVFDTDKGIKTPNALEQEGKFLAFTAKTIKAKIKEMVVPASSVYKYEGGAWKKVGDTAAVPETAVVTFDGSEHSLIDNPDLYVLGGEHKATDAGIYRASIRFKEGGWWEDGVSDVRLMFWVILPADISGNSVEIGNQKYKGSPVEPIPSVVINGRTLELGKDYEITYADNNGLGTGIAVIKGKGNYAGSITASFEIVQGHKPSSLPAAAVTIAVVIAVVAASYFLFLRPKP